MSRPRLLFKLVLVSLIFSANCQDEVTDATASTSEDYNPDRFGFGSAVEEGQNTTAVAHTTAIDTSGGGIVISVNNQTLSTGATDSTTVSPRQATQYQQQPQQQTAYQQQPLNVQYQQNQAPQQQQQQQQQANCGLYGCQPAQINAAEYLANADQYSYDNLNFRNGQSASQNQPPIFVQINQFTQPGQPQGQGQGQAQTGGQALNPQFDGQNYQQQPNNNQANQVPAQQQQQQQFGFIGQQNPPPNQQQNPQNQFNQGQGYPSQYAGQPLQDQSPPGQVQLNPTDEGSVQTLTYTNLHNDSVGRPIVEQVSYTQTGDGSNQLSVNKAELPNPAAAGQGLGQSPNVPVYLNPGQGNNLNQGAVINPQQPGQGFQQQQPQGVQTGGYYTGNANPPLNNNPNSQGQQQQPQRMPGQLIGANGVTTGGVVMAPNGQGVPLLVSADYLQNNRQTGQIKILDATFDPNQPFVDFNQFQQQNLYGNFVQLSGQYVNSQYTSSHIDGAVYFNLNVATYPSRNQKYTLYPPNMFQQYVQMLGVNQDDYIVVYSRNGLGGMQYAAAVWELFKIYNHTRVSVLNGGFNAWTTAGYPVSSELAQISPGSWRAGFDSIKLITYEEMAAIQPNGRCYLNQPGLFNFLDTRSRVDFNQNGRLYGSKSFPSNELLTQNGFIVSATDINVALARSNYTRGQQSIVLGYNGPDSSFGVLALAVVGDNTARLYNGGIDEIRLRAPAILVR